MEKTTFTIEIDTAEMEEVEKILGLPIPAAVHLFFNQVRLKKASPFDEDITDVPESVNADLMTKEEFYEKLKRGLADAEAGNYQDASEFRKEFLESRGLYDL